MAVLAVGGLSAFLPKVGLRKGGGDGGVKYNNSQKGRERFLHETDLSVEATLPEIPAMS
jgi:hypothetical protein